MTLTDINSISVSKNHLLLMKKVNVLVLWLDQCCGLRFFPVLNKNKTDVVRISLPVCVWTCQRTAEISGRFMKSRLDSSLLSLTWDLLDCSVRKNYFKPKLSFENCKQQKNTLACRAGFFMPETKVSLVIQTSSSSLEFQLVHQGISSQL